MLKLALSHFAGVRRLARAAHAERERSDRLEIDVRRLELLVHELGADVVRLSERLCATEGRLLGGRRKAAQQGTPETVEGKAQLRLVLASKLAKGARIHQETGE